MPFSIDFREDWGCVQLVHTGDLDINDAYAERYAVRDLLAAKHCRKVLVDIRLASLLMDSAEIELFLKSNVNLLPLGCRIALIVNEQLMVNEQAVNKLSMIPGVLQRMFSNEEKAVQWLWED